MIFLFIVIVPRWSWSRFFCFIGVQDIGRRSSERKAPPLFFFLPVWSSSGGCNCFVYRQSTTVQLSPFFLCLIGVQGIDCRFNPPLHPLFFHFQSDQAVEGVILLFIVRVPRFSSSRFLCLIGVQSIDCRFNPLLHLLLLCSSQSGQAVAGVMFFTHRESTTIQVVPFFWCLSGAQGIGRR